MWPKPKRPRDRNSVANSSAPAGCAPTLLSLVGSDTSTNCGFGEQEAYNRFAQGIKSKGKTGIEVAPGPVGPAHEAVDRADDLTPEAVDLALSTDAGRRFDAFREYKMEVMLYSDDSEKPMYFQLPAGGHSQQSNTGNSKRRCLMCDCWAALYLLHTAWKETEELRTSTHGLEDKMYPAAFTRIKHLCIFPSGQFVSLERQAAHKILKFFEAALIKGEMRLRMALLVQNSVNTKLSNLNFVGPKSGGFKPVPWLFNAVKEINRRIEEVETLWREDQYDTYCKEGYDLKRVEWDAGPILIRWSGFGLIKSAGLSDPTSEWQRLVTEEEKLVETARQARESERKASASAK
ncbi:hypothetical protein BJ508DRAFT_315488 [Ascobolus immersus RN42]|uniref:Uncharacterized protein n=1 Tax=Ascobolus immersus RN42 TaxID=1160509 RepID=A0A3N4HAQ6_ASCIM|nr:hypothetical protein BJ508DRAFT_315488 [Ascobolus immersus RN42]